RDSVINYLKAKHNIINLPPTITLVATPGGTNVNVGDFITLNAAAADPDGSVARVDFFANGQLLGTATAAPYSMKATIEARGSVTFSAVATDNKDATATSQPLTYNAASATVPSLTASNGLQLWLKADAGVFTGP